MNIYLFASICYFMWVFRNVLFWVALWQTKEYRFDRFWVHLIETSKGKDLLLSSLSTMKWVLIVFYIIPSLYDYLLVPYQLAIVTLLGIESLLVVREIAIRKLRRPVITFRSVGIVFLSISILSLLYTIPLVDKFLWLLLLNRIIPFVVSFFVYLFSIPSDLIKEYMIEKAARKMQLYPKVLVIGVSGSYGKSSTKDYIAQILSHSKNVVKTYGSHNTPIGIAKTILSQIKSDTEVFVVELGSYKRGEVRELCEIVRPKISVTTSISDQHLSLYGNFENIIETEKELIDAISSDGICLLNANNKNTFSLFQTIAQKKILYGNGDKVIIKNRKENKRNGYFLASHVIVSKSHVKFSFHDEKEEIVFEAPLLGAHTVENILPGIYLARLLGMGWKEIQNAVSKLSPIPKTMIRIVKDGKSYIDDTFNASPEAVLAALEYSQVYSKKKYLVLEPLIELGKNSEIDHYRIGKKIAQVCDMVFVTNGNYYKSILAGIADGERNCEIKVAHADTIAQELAARMKKDDVAIFEGRESAMVLQKLL